VHLAAILLQLFWGGALLAQSAPLARYVDDRENFVRFGPDTILARSAAGTCGSAMLLDRSELLARNAVLAASLAEAHSSVSNVRELACVRATLAVRGMTVPPGSAGMPLGVSWLAGATDAVASWLRIEPLDTAASTLTAALGMVQSRLHGVAASSPLRRYRPTDRDPSSILARIVLAVDAGNASRTALKGCTALALDLDEFAQAEQCSRRALRIGADSSWHLLRLAYIAARERKPLAEFLLTLDAAILAAKHREEVAALGWHLDYRAPGFFEDARFLMSRNDPGTERSYRDKHGWMNSTPLQRVGLFHRRMHALAETYGSGGGTEYSYVHFLAIIHAAADFRTCNARQTSPRYCNAPHLITPPTPAVPLQARLSRIWHPGTGQLTGLLSYGIGLRGLLRSREQSPDSFALRVQLWNAGEPERRYPLSIPTVDHAASDDVLPGLLRLPLGTDGEMAGQVAIVDGRGSAVAAQTVSGGPLTGADVTLSDLLIGTAQSEEAGMVWRPDATTRVPWHPYPTVDRSNRTVTLFFQIFNRAQSTTGTVTLRMLRVGDGELDPKPVVSLQWSVEIEPGLTAVEREVGLAPLKPGNYVLGVVVAPAGAVPAAPVERRVSLVIR
jgi:hypothetical protein